MGNGGMGGVATDGVLHAVRVGGTELVKIGLSVVMALQAGLQMVVPSKQQAAPNPIKMKILLGACVWPGPHSRCIVGV